MRAAQTQDDNAHVGTTSTITAPTNESTRRTFVRPNPDALGFRVAELRALGGPGRTKVYERIASGRLISRKIGATTIIDGDSFRSLMRGE